MPFLVVVAMQNSLTDLSKVILFRLSDQVIQITFAQVNQRSPQGTFLELSGVTSPSNPLPVHTCHVDRLGEDILLSTACSVVFLYEVSVARRITQCCGCQENVNARAEHIFKIFSDKTPHLLSLHKVTLIVSEKIRSEM